MITHFSFIDVVIVEVRCTGHCPHHVPAKSGFKCTNYFVVRTVGATCIYWHSFIFTNFIFYIFSNFVILKFKFIKAVQAKTIILTFGLHL